MVFFSFVVKKSSERKAFFQYFVSIWEKYFQIHNSNLCSYCSIMVYLKVLFKLDVPVS